MRIVAYIREQPVASGAEPAFAQGERIRRWAADHGHQLVALCHDHPDPAARVVAPSPGFAAVLAIVDAGIVDGVVVAAMAALGDDVATQEIRLWELRRRAAEIISTTEGDGAALSGDDGDRERADARTLLARLDAHREVPGK